MPIITTSVSSLKSISYFVFVIVQINVFVIKVSTHIILEAVIMNILEIFITLTFR